MTPLTATFSGRCQILVTGRDLVELLAPLTFHSTRNWWLPKFQHYTNEFTVPAGFVCDLASVPRWLAWLAPSWMQTSGAGVLHDYLYRTGLLSRREADWLFYEALRAEPATGVVRATAMWLAVRVFGWGAWTCNRLSER